MRLIMVGGGGFALEVEAYAYDAARARGEELHLAGIYSHDPPRLDQLQSPSAQIAHFTSLADYRPHPDDQFIIGLGHSVKRHRIAAELAAIGARLATIVHPTAYVAPTASIGPGSIVAPFAFVGPQTVVEANCVLNIYASMGHNARLGAASVLSPYATLNGGADIGRACFLGTGASVSPGLSLGDFSKISAGSVMTRHVEAGSLVHGNPGEASVRYQVPA